MRTDFSEKKNKKQKMTTITTLLLVASVLIMGVVAIAQQQTAYAQSGEGITIRAECFEDDDGGLTLLVDATGENGALFDYRVEAISGRGSVLVEENPDEILLRLNPAEPGAEYLILVWETPNGGTFDEPFSDTIIVTCPELPEEPPLTERFPNQGQCIREANADRDDDLTREDCQAAFRAERNN